MSTEAIVLLAAGLSVVAPQECVRLHPGEQYVCMSIDGGDDHCWEAPDYGVHCIDIPATLDDGDHDIEGHRKCAEGYHEPLCEHD